MFYEKGHIHHKVIHTSISYTHCQQEEEEAKPERNKGKLKLPGNSAFPGVGRMRRAAAGVLHNYTRDDMARGRG